MPCGSAARRADIALSFSRDVIYAQIRKELTYLRQSPTATLLFPDWCAILHQALSGVQIRLVMNLSSRILRGILAASTLHLMLAVPVRACPTEMAAAPTRAAHEMAMPTSHAGHDMTAMTTTPSDHAPPADAPAKSQMPCCPTPASGCEGMGCASPVVAVLSFTSIAAPSAPLLAAPSLVTTDWVSYSHAPEPPPPRA
jgi:hypothetical protein